VLDYTVKNHYDICSRSF